MKKLKILIPMLRNEPFEFFIFDFSRKNNTASNLLLKYLYFFGYSIFFLGLFLISFSGDFYQNIDSETSILKYLLIFLPLILGLYLSTVVLNGKRRIVDPEFFLAVLLFALGTTSAAVLTLNPSLSNTFGSTSIRALSGIALISFIILFYLTNIYIHNRVLLRRSIKLLLAGFILFLILRFLTLQSITDSVNINLMLITLAGIAVLTKSSINLRWFKISLIIILSVIGIWSYTHDQLATIGLSYVLLPLFFVLLVILIVFYFAKRNFLKVIFKGSMSFWEETMHSKKVDIFKFIKYLIDWLMLLSPIIVLVVFFLINRDQNILLSLQSQFEQNLKSFNVISDFSAGVNSQTINIFLFGKGSMSLVPSDSLISNVIISQGLLGLISYLAIFLYAILNGIKCLLKTFKKGGNYTLPLFLVFILLLIPLESFYFYPGMLMLTLWWFAFALLSVKSKINNKKGLVKLNDEDIEVNELKIKERKLRAYVKYLLLIFIFSADAYLVYNFIQILTKAI